MKFLYLSVLLFAFNLLQAQIVNIPDPNFKNALVNYDCVDLDGDSYGDVDADTNNDGEIQVTEAEAILSLEVNTQSISSLDGIESFVNLERLAVLYNDLTTLDTSALPNLKDLRCWENNITDLNISQNPNLEFLWCASNSLTELDVTPHSNLEYLFCGVNGLTSLDLSQNPNLIQLSCFLNSLVSLDVTQQTELEWLSFQNNGLTSIDLSQNPLLYDIDARANLLINLDLSAQINLERIWASSNELVELNIQNGNNELINTMFAFDNPDLLCIRVDDQFATRPTCLQGDLEGWCKDETASYDEDCILGVSDNSISELRLYPNPVEANLHVDHKSLVKSIKIYSTSGSLLMDTQSSTIDVSSLSSGIHFAEILTDEGIEIKKFIKQ